MRLVTVVSLALCGRGWAFDCEGEQMPWLDGVFKYGTSVSTPPTTTEYAIFFNPCSPVREHENCAADDHLCVIEKVKSDSGGESTLSAVKSYGSKLNGAKEDVNIEGNTARFYYDGSRWGEATLRASIVMSCGENESFSVKVGADILNIDVTDPTICNLKPGDGDSNNDDDDDDDSNSSGWGFFTWLFVLALLAAVAYAALTVYINFAQSRGTLPLAADIGDVLRDLPYLIRDVVRRVKQSFSTRSSTSGYAAL